MSPREKNNDQDDWLIRAYNNYEFLNSPAARNVRILTEMVEPADRLRRHRIRNTVVFFGSARSKPRQIARQELTAIEKKMKEGTKNPEKFEDEYELAKNHLEVSNYYEDAVLLAEKLTRWFNKPHISNHRFLICSGGGPGIMEAANRGAKKAGGRSIGLNIALPMEQHPNVYQTKDISFEFHYFFIRKFWFFYLAKALIVFPGGFGTLDELFELLTLIQTEKTKKYMPVVLYGEKYWNEVLNFDVMRRWGMIDTKDLKLFNIFSDVDSAFSHLKTEIKKHYFHRS